MNPAKIIFSLLVLLLPATMALAQTGKIAGQVTDGDTGDPLPGVNVVIEGTTQGAVTNLEGYYSIINVRPGTYNVRASFVGFTAQTVEDVRVNTGLTTTIDFELQPEAVGLEEMVVVAEQPIVRADVSANVANLNAEEFEDLPVAGVNQVLDLQAGIEPGLQVRGGSMSELGFLVDGLTMRTGRANEPFTEISYTSLEEVQVQTGGFNAEYGNVRAGLVNVTTKEPPRNRYTFDGLIRYAPAQDKSRNALGALPANLDDCGFGTDDVVPACDTWWLRTLIDPEVAKDGTEGVWDQYQRLQYHDFSGWNNWISQRDFDVTADDMIQYAKHVHRKDNTIDIPDYEADLTFGGPLIPGVSEQLGDLRFLFSYRGKQAAYTLPQSRDAYDANTFQLKLTSNIAQGMKLTAHGMYATEQGTNVSRDQPKAEMWKGELPPYPWSQTNVCTPFPGAPCNPEAIYGQGNRGLFAYSDGGLSLSDIDHTMIGATFTHTLNQNTFYEVTVQNMASKYRSKFPNMRDGSFICPDSGVGPNGEACEPGFFVPVPYTELGVITGRGNPGPDDITCFGGESDLNGDGEVKPYCVGEEPFGFLGQGGNLEGSGVTTGGHWNKTRDTSDVNVFTGRFDLTSQLNRFMQVKTGAELIISDYNMNFSKVELALVGTEPSIDVPYEAAPIQGAAYAQTKLEFQGMVANLGVRLDYFDANVEWWEFGPYEAVFARTKEQLDATLEKAETDAQVFLSPRVGVSFPITENSKLYFNYGHFRQMLDPSSIFEVRQRVLTGIDFIGNPEHPMPKTVAYELGYDQNLFDLFLVRVAGFYRDIQEQPRRVTFIDLGDLVNYISYRPWNYEDIRGAEISISKTRGRWIRGFVNYTFQQTKSGNFGYGQFDENPFDMRQYLQTQFYAQSVPLAQPFANMNLILLTPQEDFGPEVAGTHPLSNWRVSLLGQWREGNKFIWGGRGGAPSELRENVSWRDYWNFDLRFTKHLNTSLGSAQLFLDVTNVFNLRHVYQNAAFHNDNQDFALYMESLHLPGDVMDGINQVDADAPFEEKTGLPYLWVPGNDQPGDFRDPDAAFQPIEAVERLEDASPNEAAWFWERRSGDYFRWTGSDWEPVPDGEVDQVLEDKAYIDMPDIRFNTFLNPRRFTLGLRISF